jgi:V-type H+-transporting ATPase subunit a
MLGIMAFYCGFIYNEWFAIPTNMFGSCYDLNIYNSQGEPLTPLSLSETPPSGALSVKTDDVPRVYRRHEAKCVYPFGEDPAWSVANNKLVFSNSIKMKMAVIFGVLHMTFGIIHKGLNSSFFRKWADLLSQVFTGFIILWGLFGWMDILIIFKFFRTIDIDDLSGGPTQLTDL